MRNSRFSLKGTLQDVTFHVGKIATFALVMALVMLPIVGIWLTWGGNVLQGSLTTFDWSVGDKGQVLPTKGLLFLAGPVAFLLAFNLLRFIAVLVSSVRSADVSVPMYVSYVISGVSLWVMKFYGATFALWLALAEHGPHERYWPFASVIGLGISSWLLVKSEYLYGFKAGPSQLSLTVS